MVLASLLPGLSDRLPLNCGCTLADNQSESTMVRIAWPFPLLLTEACGDAKENVRSEFRLCFGAGIMPTTLVAAWILLLLALSIGLQEGYCFTLTMIRPH